MWEPIQTTEIACEHTLTFLPSTEFIKGIYSTVRIPQSFMFIINKMIYLWSHCNHLTENPSLTLIKTLEGNCYNL